MKLLDLFSGIGGFHLGLEQSGFEFDWVGFSEIDKYASKQYKKRFPNAKELGSVTDIQCEQLPEHIDILCGGFPCQSFSIAGLRGGFEDTRGTLFFEIVRILQHYKDSGNPINHFILENVKGLLSHDDGKTFATIYGVLADLDYSVECQLLNTRWFLPQNRERIYIVGHSGGESRPKIFPIGEDDGKNNKIRSRNIDVMSSSASPLEFGWTENVGALRARDYKDPKLVKTEGLKQIGKVCNGDAGRVFDSNGISCTLKSEGCGWGAKTGLYQVKPVLTPEIMAYSKSHRTGSSDADKRRKNYGKVEHRIKTDEFNTLSTGKGCSNMSSANYVKEEPKILDDYNNKIREDGTCGAITQHCSRSAPKNGFKVINNSSIRRLTPTECERLQGFPDGWTEGQSDTQRYKQLGNAVSVPVVKAVGDKLIELL